MRTMIVLFILAVSVFPSSSSASYEQTPRIVLVQDGAFEGYCRMVYCEDPLFLVVGMQNGANQAEFCKKFSCDGEVPVVGIVPQGVTQGETQAQRAVREKIAREVLAHNQRRTKLVSANEVVQVQSSGGMPATVVFDGSRPSVLVLPAVVHDAKSRRVVSCIPGFYCDRILAHVSQDVSEIPDVSSFFKRLWRWLRKK